jgi:hypothetical protein
MKGASFSAALKPKKAGKTDHRGASKELKIRHSSRKR